MYKLPPELKLEILSYLPFYESKHLYCEFKLQIPIKIIKNWYQNNVLLQLRKTIAWKLTLKANVFYLMIEMARLAYS